jgi:hypothetical protein
MPPRNKVFLAVPLDPDLPCLLSDPDRLFRHDRLDPRMARARRAAQADPSRHRNMQPKLLRTLVHTIGGASKLDPVETGRRG